MDYTRIVRLTRQAAERHHWKAMLNLASLYLAGRHRPNGRDKAVALVEEAIDLGIPASYDRMGVYQQNGTATYSGGADAYALFQHAAEIGNPQSMAFLGEKIDAGADGLATGYWGNIPVAIKMFECALAQGYGKGADELQFMYDVPRNPDGSEAGKATRENFDRVMRAMQDGVRGGSEMAAISLFVEFGNPVHSPAYVYVPFLDKARSERYGVLADAISFNPDRRFPNLDKILPLPPAPLPPWDGTRNSLLAAAMAVIPVPRITQPTEASVRKGRYFLDQAYAYLPTQETSKAAAAPYSSYWQPTTIRGSKTLQTFLSTIYPGLYRIGEAFDQPAFPDNIGREDIAQVIWQRVLTVHNNDGAAEPRAVRTLARRVARPVPDVIGEERDICPVTGTWQPWVRPGHPLEQAVNQPWRQRWLTANLPFPDVRKDWMLPLSNGDLKWHLIEAEAVPK